MTKIERIRYQIKLWKTVEDENRKAGDSDSAKCAYFMINGLEMALEIIKEPSNTQIQTDVAEYSAESNRCPTFNTTGKLVCGGCTLYC